MPRWQIILMVLLTTMLPFGSATADKIFGAWATEEGKAHVEITSCGKNLCGSIIWLKEPLDEQGQPKHDENNPDIALQSRRILGLPLLANFTAGDEADIWENGSIYNPEDGEIYSCTITFLDSNTLKVRGYVGLPLFGKTQVWTRVN